ncbi:TetR/AcrR family transcriptional regulator [Micromonospora sp. M51]|uniref:TetR/AcrR family transcriptional regulator n=1 Tax=Micromonospora parva TaxID=1464048 RepID=A0ABW6VWN6_9ACTN|nr:MULTISPECIES: TetR/AcrR family transcriptional regulator [Micromonospora]MBQ1014147.1 TetR/AcrR family transcriptional regulator [Micromonospora sp. M51]MBQ1032892.1 TetR/AcrR family transcriptional regulator [Micromonospora sp. C97]
MRRSDAARTALLDAAERLFAESGVAEVSDRRVAEAAGNTNHSAVRYYFGGREGLLKALMARHVHDVAEQREGMPPPEDSVLGDIRGLVEPSMRVLDRLPRPSWRARFLEHMLHNPTTLPIMQEVQDTTPQALELRESLAARLRHLDPEVVAGRALLITRIVSTTTAEVEARAERNGEDPRWPEVGDFLVDAITGMLSAPISRPRRAER